jgi:hypothetical protein
MIRPRSHTGTHDWVAFIGHDQLITIEGTVEYTVTPGVKGCHTQRNGDPGWPDDPPECELETPTVTTITFAGEDFNFEVVPKTSDAKELQAFADAMFSLCDADELIEEIFQKETD